METAVTKNQEEIIIPSFKDWMINYLIVSIPLVGFIFMIIWAVDSDPRNLIRKRWAGAMLAWVAIVTVLALVLWFALFAALLAGGKFGGLTPQDTFQIDTAALNYTTDSILNSIDTTMLDLPVDTSGN